MSKFIPKVQTLDGRDLILTTTVLCTVCGHLHRTTHAGVLVCWDVENRWCKCDHPVDPEFLRHVRLVGIAEAANNVTRAPIVVTSEKSK